QPEPEKAPLEEAKNEVIEIDETKLDGEKGEAVVEADPEKGKEVEEAN
ncbi:unnamed protein product, partial [Lymnaea stagnalis]